MRNVIFSAAPKELRLTLKTQQHVLESFKLACHAINLKTWNAYKSVGMLPGISRRPGTRPQICRYVTRNIQAPRDRPKNLQVCYQEYLGAPGARPQIYRYVTRNIQAPRDTPKNLQVSYTTPLVNDNAMTACHLKQSGYKITY